MKAFEAYGRGRADATAAERERLGAPDSHVEVVRAVMGYVNKHIATHRDEPESRWLAALVAEVGELADSLHGKHYHPPELELAQIASIAINWLQMREADGENPGW